MRKYGNNKLEIRKSLAEVDNLSTSAKDWTSTCMGASAKNAEIG